MGIIDILLTGVGLSMDAAAVSMTNGMNEPKMKLPKILLITLFYGVAQGVMPLIGYYAGSLVRHRRGKNRAVARAGVARLYRRQNDF